MKKYIAHLGETSTYELTEEQYNKCETKTVVFGDLTTGCKIIYSEYGGKPFFVLYPISEFEVVDE